MIRRALLVAVCVWSLATGLKAYAREVALLEPVRRGTPPPPPPPHRPNSARRVWM